MEETESINLTDRIELRRFVGRELLLWLWMESELFEATLSTAEHGSFGLWLEGRLVLDEGKESTTIKGTTPGLHREAKESLLRGKTPERAGLHLSFGDHDCALTLRGETLAFAGLAPPVKEKPKLGEPKVEDAAHDTFYERMHFAEQVEGVVTALYRDFLRLRLAPAWDKDPYRVFVYTTLQERATQVSHANTGKLASEYEPTIGMVLSNVAKEEARHYTFYRTIFKEVLERDPNRALASAAEIMPSIDMPGVNMPHFRELADVIRRAGIYGPRDYLKIVEEQIKFWTVETLTGLDEVGTRAQEIILGIPKRLERVADVLDLRSRPKSFSFAVAFNREFRMD